MSLEEAKELDVQFQTFKKDFEIPTLKSLGVVDEKADDDSETIYLCGNSLGPLPKDTRKALEIELNAWGARGVESHFNHPYINDGYTSWVDIDLPLLPLISPIVGAHINEVAVMGSLTSNLNAMLMSFYKPRGSKTKILFEKNAFPSDYYAFLNMVKLFGYDESHIIQLSPRANEFCLRTEDILKAISIHHEELALVCFPGIQYYTGQLFDIKTITAYAKRYDLTVGWDLAHAVGNVVLKLHEWNVDFAVWCSYKYLNSGPGGIAGIYVHEKYTKDNSKKNFQPRLAGWWGNNLEIRFKMIEEFDPINSALSYRQSNPSVLDCVALRSSLEIFKKKGGIELLREHSIKLTNFLEKILTTSKYSIDDPNDTKSLGFKIITPRNEEERGCQLSLLFQPHSEDQDKNTMERVLRYIHSLGIICDERRPDVIRLAPIPLFNTFEETFVAAHRLIEVLDKIDKST